MTLILLRFNFVYADFIRFFGRTYAYQDRDWDAINDIIESVADVAPAEGYPKTNFDRAFRVMTRGIPLAGNYRCSFESVAERNMYNNHRTIDEEVTRGLIRKKFARRKSIPTTSCSPRLDLRFIYGQFLSPLTFMAPKYELRVFLRVTRAQSRLFFSDCLPSC
jgi:hypothetical protein